MLPIQRYTFLQNRFYGLRLSDRSSASVGVNKRGDLEYPENPEHLNILWSDWISRLES